MRQSGQLDGFARHPILASGSEVASINRVTLTANDLPLSNFGYFLASNAPGLIMNPGGSQGHLCLGGGIGRYNQLGQIQFSGPFGSIRYTLDLTNVPRPSGFAAVTAGETWHFQAWHRDNQAGSGESNFSDGVSILFM